jgi:hypothetical protein
MCGMEHKDFRKTATLYSGKVGRAHITRTSTGTRVIRVGKIDTGLGHMDDMTNTKYVCNLCDKQVMKTRQTC